MKISYGASESGYGRLITIDNTGGDRQTDYPVKIELTINNFDFDQTDGTDIRFVDGGWNGTPYWRESWDASNKTATLWAKVPEIPKNGITAIILIYGETGASDVSDGSQVFTFFDDFASQGPDHSIPVGTDSGFSADFDPITRNFVVFGQDGAGGSGHNAVVKVNIDTWQPGFCWPGLDTPVHSAGVIYHHQRRQFFVYGGREMSAGTRVDTVQVYDDTLVDFTVRPEILPAPASAIGVGKDPDSRLVYLFGGIDGTTAKNTIWVHDPNAETVVSTGATLPEALASVGVVWSSVTEKFYLFGGFKTTSDDTDKVYSYDPATPSTNPVQVATLSQKMQDHAGVEDPVSGFIYTFSGYRGDTGTYLNPIHRFNPLTNTITLLAETMHRVDDDCRAFYDPETLRIYVGPMLHSLQLTDNQVLEKVVVYEFDPATETLAAEPGLFTTTNAPPTGWTNEVDALISTKRFHTINEHWFAETTTTAQISGQKAISLTTGVYMFEVYVDALEGVFHWTIRESGSARLYIQKTGNQWQISHSGALGNFTNFVPGYHILGMLVDMANQQYQGILDRGVPSASNTFHAAMSSTLNQIRHTAGNNSRWLNKWVLARKSTLGDEPTTIVGDEISL